MQLRPERQQRVGIFGQQRLVPAEAVVPAIEPGQRLDDQRKAQSELCRFDGVRVEAARRRNRETVPLRKCLEACLVEEIFNQICFGGDETERLGQALAMARDQKRLRVLLIEQHRRLRLRGAEREKAIDEPFAAVAIVVPDEACAGIARIQRRHARAADHGAGDPRQRQRPSRSMSPMTQACAVGAEREAVRLASRSVRALPDSVADGAAPARGDAPQQRRLFDQPHAPPLRA